MLSHQGSRGHLERVALTCLSLARYVINLVDADEGMVVEGVERKKRVEMQVLRKPLKRD
jgi:hypothetical protein